MDWHLQACDCQEWDGFCLMWQDHKSTFNDSWPRSAEKNLVLPTPSVWQGNANQLLWLRSGNLKAVLVWQNFQEGSFHTSIIFNVLILQKKNIQPFFGKWPWNSTTKKKILNLFQFSALGWLIFKQLLCKINLAGGVTFRTQLDEPLKGNWAERLHDSINWTRV